MMRDEKWVQMGFRSYQRFYELSQNTTKPRSWEDFINSKYYLSFSKFGKYCHGMQVVMFSEYVDFVINHGLKIDAWTDDRVYELYIKEYQKKESIDAALARSIKFMEIWSINYDKHWSDFFRFAEKGLLTYWLKTGRISPWVIFNCDSGVGLLGTLSNEQMSIVSTMVDPNEWSQRLRARRDDCVSIREILSQAGL